MEDVDLDITSHPLTQKVADVILAYLIEQYCTDALAGIPLKEPVDIVEFSPKAEEFLTALAALCREHHVFLTASSNESLQLWNMKATTLLPWGFNGIEDRTGCLREEEEGMPE